MLLFEAFVAQQAPTVVEEAVVHFVARHRGRLTEHALVPRTRALGLLEAESLAVASLRRPEFWVPAAGTTAEFDR